MRLRISLLLLVLLSLPALSRATIIFRPGEKVKFLAPGEEEVNGTAQQLFAIAQEAEQKGNTKRAMRAYERLWHKYPHDTLAPGAAFRDAQLLEEQRQYPQAANTYRVVVERYPNSPHFNEAIESQFRIGEMYLNGKKVKLLGIPLITSMDRAVDIFAAVIKTAPYGQYTARAQFDIGLARQKQGANDAAVNAYQAVIDKFPNEPIAADAQYQIGYIWFEAARLGTNDVAATANARTGFQDFLFRYPKSEKVAQARANLARLDQKSTSDAIKVAKFYDKQKKYRAAVIYYNEVIRDQPGAGVSEQAKRRIAQIRAKVGDRALEPAVAVSDKKKSVASREPAGASRGRPTLRGGDSEVAPLPPPEQDSALPPPASMAPPTTTAPEPPPGLGEPLPSPAPSASPDVPPGQ